MSGRDRVTEKLEGGWRDKRVGVIMQPRGWGWEGCRNSSRMRGQVSKVGRAPG